MSEFHYLWSVNVRPAVRQSARRPTAVPCSRRGKLMWAVGCIVLECRNPWLPPEPLWSHTPLAFFSFLFFSFFSFSFVSPRARVKTRDPFRFTFSLQPPPRPSPAAPLADASRAPKDRAACLPSPRAQAKPQLPDSRRTLRQRSGRERQRRRHHAQTPKPRGIRACRS